MFFYLFWRLSAQTRETNNCLQADAGQATPWICGIAHTVALVTRGGCDFLSGGLGLVLCMKSTPAML